MLFQTASEAGSDASDQLFTCARVDLSSGPPSWYRTAYTCGQPSSARLSFASHATFSAGGPASATSTKSGFPG